MNSDSNSGYTNHNNMKSATRAFAIAIIFLLIVGYFMPAVFIFTHIDHEHDFNGPGGSCDVCVYLAAAKSMQKRLNAPMVVAFFAFAYISVILIVFKSSDYHAISYTLVRMKVRINN